MSDDKGLIEAMELAGFDMLNERRIKELERYLNEIDAEVDDYIDINNAGGPNLAMKIRMIIDEALRR